MGIKRIVDVQFWNDDKVLELFSPEDKLFMLYLMTNPHTTQLGIYAINKKHIAFELGYSIDTINILIDRFENKYEMIKYSNTTKEVAIKNYLRHSILKGGKPVEDCLKKEIKQVKDKSLLSYVYSNIKDCETLNITVRNVIETFKNDNDTSTIRERYADNENENENENENDKLLHKSAKSTLSKKSFGEYKRIKLTEKQYKKLCDDFGKDIIDKQITLLDEYVESNNNKNKYSNFNLVLRKSIRENWFKPKTAPSNNYKRKEIVPDWMNKKIEEKPMTKEQQQEMDKVMKDLDDVLNERVEKLKERLRG